MITTLALLTDDQIRSADLVHAVDPDHPRFLALIPVRPETEWVPNRAGRVSARVLVVAVRRHAGQLGQLCDRVRRVAPPRHEPAGV